jgi:hypothetical protein
MVIAISGFGMGFRSVEHRLVSHSGTSTVNDKAGSARRVDERETDTVRQGEN